MPASAMFDWPLPSAVVAHDAGAANLIIAWLKAWQWPVQAYFDGPAQLLWNHAFPGKKLSPTIEEAINGTASVITGTGWGSSVEHEARKLAKSRKLRAAAVLDHWVNYPPRFERNGEVVLPDEVWVADDYAALIASKVLPPLPIRVHENLYLRTQLERITPLPGDGTLLYVFEPVRSNWGRSEDGEYQAFNYFLQQLSLLNGIRVNRIVLRPHPSDMVGKYDHFLRTNPIVEMDSSIDISLAISRADFVVGVESFALVLALAAGRTVFSSLPPWAPALRLPQEGIQQIRRLFPT